MEMYQNRKRPGQMPQKHRSNQFKAFIQAHMVSRITHLSWWSLLILHIVSDSASSSPLALDAPCDLPASGVTTSNSNQQILPTNLAPIYGTPTQNRRTENERKIVLYILAADDVHKDEKNVLSNMYQELKEYSACRGFELQISDAHEQSDNFLDPKCWVDEPLEARGGHHLAAQCLSEIASELTAIRCHQCRSENNFFINLQDIRIRRTLCPFCFSAQHWAVHYCR